MKRMIVALAVASTLAGTLAGCSNQGQFTPLPVSAGSGPNALKRTPCAGNPGSPCAPVRNRTDMPGFMTGDYRPKANG